MWTCKKGWIITTVSVVVHPVVYATTSQKCKVIWLPDLSFLLCLLCGFSGFERLRLKDCLEYYRSKIAPSRNVPQMPSMTSMPSISHANGVPPNGLGLNRPELSGYQNPLYCHHTPVPNQPISSAAAVIKQPYVVTASSISPAAQLSQGQISFAPGQAMSRPSNAAHPGIQDFPGQQYQPQLGSQLPVHFRHQHPQLPVSQFIPVHSNSLSITSTFPNPRTTSKVIGTPQQAQGNSGNLQNSAAFSTIPQDILFQQSLSMAQQQNQPVSSYPPSFIPHPTNTAVIGDGGRLKLVNSSSAVGSTPHQQQQVGQLSANPVGAVPVPVSSHLQPMPYPHAQSPFAPIRMCSDFASDVAAATTVAPALPKPVIGPPQSIIVSWQLKLIKNLIKFS